MRKIINSTYISLDAVVEQPHLWTTQTQSQLTMPSWRRG